MKRGFIKQMSSAKELYKRMQLFANAGVAIENITIDTDFEQFSKTVIPGDTIVFDSYTSIFNSLTNFFNASIKLVERGVALESLSEPNIRVNAETIDMFRALSTLGASLRKKITMRGLSKALSEGKKLGRPVGSTKFHSQILQINELCDKMHLSVAEACRRVGCLPRTYYRHKNKVEAFAAD